MAESIPFKALDATLGTFGVDANAFDFASFDAAFADESGPGPSAAVIPASTAPRVVPQQQGVSVCSEQMMFTPALAWALRLHCCYVCTFLCLSLSLSACAMHCVRQPQ